MNKSISMNRNRNLIISLVLFICILAGCSAAPANNNADTSKNTSNSTSTKTEQENKQLNDGDATKSSASANEADVWPRTIIDGTGKEIVLEKKPERVAVLHPMYMDYFFALGSPPIASTGATKALEEFATLKQYAGTAEVIDLGGGRETNMELLLESNPDVIVTFKGSIDTIYDELVKIAPVIQIEYTDPWPVTTMLCAKIVGKEELAEKYIEETKALIAKTKEQLGDRKNETFALLRVDGKANFVAQGAKNTMYYDQTEGFGLLAPKGYPEDSEVLSLEALSELNPDYLIIQHDFQIAQAAVKEKETLEVWKSLTAVKNNHVLLFDNSLNSLSVLAVRLASDHFMNLKD